jgi:hypothetical protein
MPTQSYVRAAAILITATLVLAVFAAWRADRRDRAQLAVDLAAANKSLAQATARQHGRDTQLQKTLAALATEKRNIKTTAQLIADLPNQIPLPEAITLQSADPEATSPTPPCSSGLFRSARDPMFGPEGLGSRPPSIDERSSGNCKGTACLPRQGHPCSSVSTQAILPSADLKPLYGFAIECKICQAKLAAAQADLTDERAKTAVLTQERNEAVKAAKGGSLLRRIARNAKWLAIGAAAGALAAKAHP